MPTPQELETKFWDALRCDGVMMLGLDGVDEGHTRPMTAQVDHERGPIWFFTSRDAKIAQNLGNGRRAVATFTSRGHDLFAAVHGSVRVDNNREVIDRLWNRNIAAWYQDGKNDPTLTLLRFDAERAEIWLDGSSSLIAGIRILFGADPKSGLKDNVANVMLR